MTPDVFYLYIGILLFMALAGVGNTKATDSFSKSITALILLLLTVFELVIVIKCLLAIFPLV